MSKYLLSKLEFEYAETFATLAANLEFVFRTPAPSATFIGCKLEAYCAITKAASSVVLSLTEGVTATDSVAVVPLNKHRLDTPPACPVPVNKNVVGATGGTLLTAKAAALSAPACLGGYILKPSTVYLVKLAQSGSPDGSITFGLCVIPSLDYLNKGSPY